MKGSLFKRTLEHETHAKGSWFNRTSNSSERINKTVENQTHMKEFMVY